MGSMLCLLSGCESLADLRAQAPTVTMAAPGDFEALANCVAGLTEDSKEPPPRLRVDRAARTAHLYYVFESSNSAAYDLKFQQRSQSEVYIEGRGMATVNGRDALLKPMVQRVNQCAGVKSSAG